MGPEVLLLASNMAGMADLTSLSDGLLGAVPFARTLGAQFIGMADGGRVMTVRMPDAASLHNHVGGPHAGALFGLGDTASGAVVTAVFAERLGQAVPLVVRAEIAYLKLARGAVDATARLGRSSEEVLAELDAGGRPEFPVDVEITREDGSVAARMRIFWMLRPN
jgi:acyl-coenzyme A thioesterase PaaI-like protein